MQNRLIFFLYSSKQSDISCVVRCRLTFDNMSRVLVVAHECSVDGTFQAQFLLDGLGVTVHMGVGLSNFVKKHMLVLRWNT